MPARRHAYPARHGNPRQGRDPAGTADAPDRAGRPRLWPRRRWLAANREERMNDQQTAARRQLTRADILPLDEYVKIRRERRREISELKRQRRVEVGPVATSSFGTFPVMWQPGEEMPYR